MIKATKATNNVNMIPINPDNIEMSNDVKEVIKKIKRNIHLIAAKTFESYAHFFIQDIELAKDTTKNSQDCIEDLTKQLEDLI